MRLVVAVPLGVDETLMVLVTDAECEREGVVDIEDVLDSVTELDALGLSLGVSDAV